MNYDKWNSDPYLGRPNPYVKCPECDAKERYQVIELHCVTIDETGMVMGCPWCGCSITKFAIPVEILEYELEGYDFRLDSTKYEPYFWNLFLETLRDNITDIPKVRTIHGREAHIKPAVALDRCNLSAADKYGGLRDINRGFLEILAAVTTREEHKHLYENELDRRDHVRPKKRKKSGGKRKLPYSPKKPRAGEHIKEVSRGWRKDYWS